MAMLSSVTYAMSSSPVDQADGRVPWHCPTLISLTPAMNPSRVPRAPRPTAIYFSERSFP